MTLLIIALIILTPFFAFYMAAAKNREKNDWRSKREDYLNGEYDPAEKNT